MSAFRPAAAWSPTASAVALTRRALRLARAALCRPRHARSGRRRADIDRWRQGLIGRRLSRNRRLGARGRRTWSHRSCRRSPGSRRMDRPPARRPRAMAEHSARRAGAGAARCGRAWRRLAPFEHVQLLRLLLDRTQREPTGQRHHVDRALGRVERPFEIDHHFGADAARRGAHRARQCQPRVEGAVGEIEDAADRKVGALRAHARVAQTRLTGADRDRALRQRDRQRAARERRIHPVPDPRGVDRQTLVDRADDRGECRRIDTRQPCVLEREGAAAAERSDQRDRAQAGALGGDVEREPAGQQCGAIARKQLGRDWRR